MGNGATQELIARRLGVTNATQEGVRQAVKQVNIFILQAKKQEIRQLNFGINGRASNERYTF